MSNLIAPDRDNRPTSVCVYCGTGVGRTPEYMDAARDLGRRLAESGIEVVYGGGSLGLMGAVAQSAIDAGGRVVGIIPGFLEEREGKMPTLTETIVTDDMHERKRTMFERADAFVALPGGIGTLEEVVEILTWGQLGQHAKPVVLADIEGFWRPLVELFSHMREEGFLRPGFEVDYCVAKSVDEILSSIEAARVETSARPGVADMDQL